MKIENEFVESFNRLRLYCEKENFKGWDPFDGMNSWFFEHSPLKYSKLCRLVMIQLFKRNPVNLRRLFLVPKGHNAKGIGLFLQGYVYLYQLVDKHPEMASAFGSKTDLKRRVDELASLLLSLKSDGYAGACWGYNFDWQSRFIFHFPKGTPTVVASTFCATALMDAYEVTGNKRYLEEALTTADFVIKDLNHTPHKGGILMSYSPKIAYGAVYNATLLGAKLLAHCYKYTGKEAYREIARQAVEACVQDQQPDGSWVYSTIAVQNWIDSFHTGYNLESLYEYQEITGDRTYQKQISEGLRFYQEHFFEQGYIPKYFHNRMYPIDIHCPAQYVLTLCRMNLFGPNREQIEKIIRWTNQNMQDRRGYYYYQKKNRLTTKIPYMRWSNAFMFTMYALYFKNAVEG